MLTVNYLVICQQNKEKRLAWAQQHLGETFEDVIWTDECTVQMENRTGFLCRKRGDAPRPNRDIKILCGASII